MIGGLLLVCMYQVQGGNVVGDSRSLHCVRVSLRMRYFLENANGNITSVKVG